MGRVKEMLIDGNAQCIYAFIGLNRVRCSREGNEGNYCQYWKNCKFFTKDGK